MRYGAEILAGLLTCGALLYGMHWQEQRAHLKVNRTWAANEAETLARAAHSWKRRYGAYPNGLPARLDPWGRTYGLRVERGSMRVCSSGPDRKPDTGDDICSNLQEPVGERRSA